MGHIFSIFKDEDESGSTYSFNNYTNMEKRDHHLINNCTSLEDFITQNGNPIVIQKKEDGFDPRDQKEQEFIHKNKDEITHRLEYDKFTAFATKLWSERSSPLPNHFIFELIPYKPTMNGAFT